MAPRDRRASIAETFTLAKTHADSHEHCVFGDEIEVDRKLETKDIETNHCFAFNIDGMKLSRKTYH